MSPAADMPQTGRMARGRLLHLAIGAAIALALIAAAPGQAPSLRIPAAGLLQSLVSNTNAR